MNALNQAWDQVWSQIWGEVWNQDRDEARMWDHIIRVIDENI